MYHLSEAYPMAAYICLLAACLGALIFGTGAVASLAVRLLPEDAGNEKRFNRLHRLDVALVSTGMLTGLLLLIALVYVLPGQFTFWPAAGL
jgi:succinate dehydrogenase/fumarate reductase cytochrome b subunit